MDIDVKRTTVTGPAPELRPFQPLAHLAPPGSHEIPVTLPLQSPTAALVSKPVAAILAVLATILGFGAGVVSAPASWALAAAAVALAVLAGVTGFKVPAFTVGRPLVKAGWIGPLATIAGFLVDYSLTLPDGYLKGAMVAAAIVCVGLAGVPLPAPRGGGQ